MITYVYSFILRNINIVNNIYRVDGLIEIDTKT